MMLAGTRVHVSRLNPSMLYRSLNPIFTTRGSQSVTAQLRLFIKNSGNGAGEFVILKFTTKTKYNSLHLEYTTYFFRLHRKARTLNKFSASPAKPKAVHLADATNDTRESPRI